MLFFMSIATEGIRRRAIDAYQNGRGTQSAVWSGWIHYGWFVFHMPILNGIGGQPRLSI